jgi:hypothetical protein
MEQIVELLKEINIAQVFVVLAGVWVFYNRLDNKIEKNHEKLSSKIEDIDRRLCRIEGSLSTYGHCLLSQSSYEKKAE